MFYVDKWKEISEAHWSLQDRKLVIIDLFLVLRHSACHSKFEEMGPDTKFE